MPGSYYQLESLRWGKEFNNIYRITIRGLIGSAIMLGGIVFIKPMFLSLSAVERQQRKLDEELQDNPSQVKLLSGYLPNLCFVQENP